MAFETGTLLGDYEVLGPIGAGGMGTVYKVRNTVSQRIEALKVLLPDLHAAAHLEERFLREIRVLASLAHPNIATLHTAFRLNNQLLMIMEFVEGRALPEILNSGRIPPVVCVDYATQALAAVACAHDKGVVHRDIKPSNIMVNSQGTVKLLDFGIATVAAAEKLTRTGMVLGSLHYMSPEQVQAGPADARSDVYSLGVTFYELFTGRCPIEGDSDYAVMSAHLFVTPPPAAQTDPRVPRAISDVIAKALEKNPANRFASAADFLAAFQSAARHISAEPSPAPIPESTQTLAEPIEAPVRRPRPSTAGRQSGTVDAAAIDAVSKQLALFIGPVARVVVRNAAARSHTVGELCETVASEIADAGDRARFLAAARRIKTNT